MSRILIQDASETVVVENVILAESTKARARGLLGRSGLPADTGMLLRPCRSIHMWFMRFAIDAAFLDKNLKVLYVARGLRPWRLAIAPRGTACVLETAADALAPVSVGDSLKWDDAEDLPEQLPS